MKRLELILTEEGNTLLRLELPTQLNATELLAAVHQLTGEVRVNSRGPLQVPASRKYRGLSEHLEQSKLSSLRLSFGGVEHLLGAPLPASAREHRAWWANSESHSQARAWLSVGWQMESVDLKTESVTFRKEA